MWSSEVDTTNLLMAGPRAGHPEIGEKEREFAQIENSPRAKLDGRVNPCHEEGWRFALLMILHS
jgi:hypothetical protein